MADDFSSHVILLGGIGWNKVAARFQRATSQVPIEQTAVDDLAGGDIFEVQSPDGRQSFYPEYEDLGEGKELIADVGYLARLRNPFQHSRTLNHLQRHSQSRCFRSGALSYRCASSRG